MRTIHRRSDLKVVVRPDSDFSAASPKDARYVIDTVDVLVQRGIGGPARVASVSGSGKDATAGIKFPLGNLLETDAPGTIAYLKVRSVKRVNFMGKKFNVHLADQLLALPFVIQ